MPSSSTDNAPGTRQSRAADTSRQVSERRQAPRPQIRSRPGLSFRPTEGHPPPQRRSGRHGTRQKTWGSLEKVGGGWVTAGPGPRAASGFSCLKGNGPRQAREAGMGGRGLGSSPCPNACAGVAWDHRDISLRAAWSGGCRPRKSEAKSPVQELESE